MKVLVACEFSGIVRDAFIAKGHDAMSCDLLPTERPGPPTPVGLREAAESQVATYVTLLVTADAGCARASVRLSRLNVRSNVFIPIISSSNYFLANFLANPSKARHVEFSVTTIHASRSHM